MDQPIEEKWKSTFWIQSQLKVDYVTAVKTIKLIENLLEQERRRLVEEMGGDDVEGDELGDEVAGDGLTLALQSMDEGSKQDDLYDEVRRIVIQSGRASTHNLQTTFGIGYPRAARLMHLLEENGVIEMVDGKKKVLLSNAPEAAEGVEEEEWVESHMKVVKEVLYHVKSQGAIEERQRILGLPCMKDEKLVGDDVEESYWHSESRNALRRELKKEIKI